MTGGPVALKRSLWPERWPSIALRECQDKVAAADPGDRSVVLYELPCATCHAADGCLNAKRKELGGLMFDREILTKPRSSESSLFPRELFEPMLDRRQSQVRTWLKPFSVESRYAIVQAWDIAWSEKIGGDWLVCETAYVDRQTGARQLLEIRRWQRLTFQEQIDLIVRKWLQFRSDLVVIEGDAAQQVWKQQVRDTTPVPVRAHDSSSKTDFAAGVPGLLVLLENQKWRFPYEPGSYGVDEVDTFLAEMEAFGWTDGHLDGVGEHDDTVMCFWHLNWGLDLMVHTTSSAMSQHRGVQQGKYI